MISVDKFVEKHFSLETLEKTHERECETRSELIKLMEDYKDGIITDEDIVKMTKESNDRLMKALKEHENDAKRYYIEVKEKGANK